ncbi:Sensor kinase CusS [Planctomycetes bacterium Poly30]|uniref:histidine kinase n=1 Tax=Saltatorellus ferox TaxID=2528018 RepID=A0A518ENH4_9BACT|nr:Sensor kinase CusS [Planctomycetes bacterium Poly30]
MTEIKSTASRGWSVRGRLTLWIMTGALALVLLSTLFSLWQTRESLRREMRSLAVEEMAEISSSCLTGPMTDERFAEICAEHNRHHPEFEIRCRAWSVSEMRWIGEGGGRPSLELPPAGPAPIGYGASLSTPYQFLRTRLAPRSFTQAEAGDDFLRASGAGLVLELLIDGAKREEQLAKTSSVFVLIALLIAAAMVASGIVFANRLARLLSQVADSAHAARLGGSPETGSLVGAPRKVRAVAEAFQSSVAHMQEEHARNILMTAGLAHELRSPLHNMMTEAEIALLRPRENDEYRRIVGRQLHEMKEFALVVDNLITMTALRDTKGMERKEYFDFGDEAVRRLQREEDLGDQRGVEVVVQRSGDLRVAGDREALILMLRNLVGNAIRWTPPETSVTVTMEGTPDEIRLYVDDEGPGIPKEEREQVFHAFHQGATPDGQRAGYGLGLALARAATEAHGGQIRADEAEGGGARLVVHLPRSVSADTPEGDEKDVDRAGVPGDGRRGPAIGTVPVSA